MFNLISWSLILMKRQNVRTEGESGEGWRGGAGPRPMTDKLKMDIDIMHIWPKSCSLSQTDPKYSLRTWETQRPRDINTSEQTNWHHRGWRFSLKSPAIFVTPQADRLERYMVPIYNASLPKMKMLMFVNVPYVIMVDHHVHVSLYVLYDNVSQSLSV